MQRLATIGDTVGEGYVDYPRGMIRDSLGRYWLGQDDDIKIFDQNGRYIGEVGRPGPGPMEFSQPLPISTDANGNVRIFDWGNSRETILNPRLEGVSAVRLAVGANFNSAAALPEAHRYAVGMWRATEDGIGHPLHVISGDTVIASFGADTSTSEAQNPFTSVRLLATDRNSRIYSAKRFDYSIDVWTSDGERIIGFEGPRLNESKVRWGPYNLDDNPLASEIIDLQVDPAGQLWVLIRCVKAGWRKYFDRAVLPNGMPGLHRKESYRMDSVYLSRLDIIDLHRGAVVAQLFSDRFLTHLIGHSLVIERVTSPNGIPQLTVWKVMLVQPNS